MFGALLCFIFFVKSVSGEFEQRLFIEYVLKMEKGHFMRLQQMCGERKHWTWFSVWIGNLKMGEKALEMKDSFKKLREGRKVYEMARRGSYVTVWKVTED